MAPRLGNVLHASACVLAVPYPRSWGHGFLPGTSLIEGWSKPHSRCRRIGGGGSPHLGYRQMFCVYIVAGNIYTHPSLKQFEERLATLERRIDSLDTRLTRYEETVGPQLKTLGSLLHQALSKRDRASHGG